MDSESTGISSAYGFAEFRRLAYDIRNRKRDSECTIRNSESECHSKMCSLHAELPRSDLRRQVDARIASECSIRVR